MIVRYFNNQDESDPMHARSVADNVQLMEILRRAQSGPPVLFDLRADNGFCLMVGVGHNLGCAQYSRADGDPPYLMAVSPNPPMRRGYMEFLAADTPTAIAGRYIIGFEEVTTIAFHFCQTGKRSDAVSWQVLSPKAAREDAERW